MTLMCIRAFPKKKDLRFKEVAFYLKNIAGANDVDFECDCPELVNVCRVMDFAEKLAVAGWKVKVEPFESYPLLSVRAKRKRKVK